MQIPAGKKIFFLSDFHLGSPDAAGSLQREKLAVQFLTEIKEQVFALFVVGDLFDFWYEYKKVVPKGFVRILGKLAEYSDAGIAVYFFVGNHDMWMKDYFQKELNIPVYFEPKEFTFSNTQFYIGHGDGLGPGDHKYKFLKSVFRNPLCQWLFGIIPSRLGIGLADYFSNKSRQTSKEVEEHFLGEEKEWLIAYSKEILQKKEFNYFIFGHRHLPIDFRLSKESRYINLGDWVRYFTYAVFDGKELQLLSYTGMEQKITRIE
ncbi:MAG: UDP-2,3-diacylglucosamine diphosphatase [Chitinophagaceae bacterium]